MCPPDPRGERDPYEDDELDGEPDASAFDIDGLTARGDVAALLACAKAFRSGTAPGGRDMAKCFAAYRAAAQLGSGEAEHAVALFYLNGSAIVPQDVKEGATHLRAAADKGVVAAKVYVANMYELGIHYKADPEKADVWYRNAARAARIDAEPGSAEHVRALAELGAARYVLALTRSPELDESEKARLLARAKAHGYGLRARDDNGEADRPTFVDALAGADPPPGAAPLASATPPPVAATVSPRDRKDTAPETVTAKRRAAERASSPAPSPENERAAARARARKAEVAAGLGAFGYALLFVLAGIGAGYAATVGARELVEHGHTLPGLGKNTRLVFPIVLGAVGVLPAWLVYRFSAVLKALVAGAGLAGIGWVAWGTGKGVLHADRELQAIAFGVAGFLAALLVLGLVGGAKKTGSAARRRAA